MGPAAVSASSSPGISGEDEALKVGRSGGTSGGVSAKGIASVFASDGISITVGVSSIMPWSSASESVLRRPFNQFQWAGEDGSDSGVSRRASVTGADASGVVSCQTADDVSGAASTGDDSAASSSDVTGGGSGPG